MSSTSNQLRPGISDETMAGAFESAPGEVIRADIVGDTLCLATWKLDADQKMKMGNDAFSCKRVHLPNLIALLQTVQELQPETEKI